ncbi:hypothetical protein CYLTODRAFT_492330 [Cylindrobasidium torrendii FP15055 ss-10]|uniref:Translational machinery component n=1 Tax=Cylindrobasidium torrendii FP15055 ss-10 TaxID=1314674 RepID=A0A0D7B4E7_9AGAR|nr:hypothetical protein CYLTODRAFT_492330 [Cylindrobasidium torrendii FP15055 ss-10]
MAAVLRLTRQVGRRGLATRAAAGSDLLSDLSQLKRGPSNTDVDDDGPPVGQPLQMRTPHVRPTSSFGSLGAQTLPPAGDKKTTQALPAQHAVVKGYDKAFWPHYRIYCKSSQNNTILTFTNEKGNPVGWSSAGTCGFKGTRGNTPEAAYAASVAIIQLVLKERYGEVPEGFLKKDGKEEKEDTKDTKGGRSRLRVQNDALVVKKNFLLDLYLNGFGVGRSTIVTTLAAPEGELVRGLLSNISDNTKLKIGGTRPKKMRRI